MTAGSALGCIKSLRPCIQLNRVLPQGGWSLVLPVSNVHALDLVLTVYVQLSGKVCVMPSHKQNNSPLLLTSGGGDLCLGAEVSVQTLLTIRCGHKAFFF